MPRLKTASVQAATKHTITGTGKSMSWHKFSSTAATNVSRNHTTDTNHDGRTQPQLQYTTQECQTTNLTTVN